MSVDSCSFMMLNDGHSWRWISATALKCNYCGETAHVDDIEGYHRGDAPDHATDPDYDKKRRDKVGLEKFYGQKF